MQLTSSKYRVLRRNVQLNMADYNCLIVLQLLKDREDGERELEADLKEAIQLIPYRAALHDTSLSGE
jgi:hypothetical protein